MNIKRRKLWVIGAITFLVISAAVLGISYYILSQLTFVADPMLYEGRQSEIAKMISDELFKRTDIEKISYPSRDGLRLSAYLIKRKNAKANLLLCHGYRNTKEFMYAYIEMFPQCNIIMFDFRAHGESEGGIITIGCHEYKDVLASAEYMKNEVRGDDGRMLPLVVLGISMGGASAVKAASVERRFCDALIIDSSFSNLNKMIRRGFSLKVGLPMFPFLYVTKAMLEYFASCSIDTMDNQKAVESIIIPILFIHSCNDSFIKPSHSMRLYEHTHAPHTKLWIGPQCRHGWLHSGYSETYKHKVEKFLKKIGIPL